MNMVRYAAIIPILVIIACSSTDLGALSNAQCPSGAKACDGQCVTLTDPRYSCGNATVCSPCALLNATSLCAPNGECAVASCNPGYKQCNGDVGCNTHTAFDVNNCGNCGTVCGFPNAVAACSNSACVVGSCLPGFADCDLSAANGCECNGACADGGKSCSAPGDAG